MNRRIFTTILVLIIFSAACGAPTLAAPAVNKIKATPTNPPAPGGKPVFGEMSFCLSYDDQTGDPIDPTTSFPSGTKSVDVVFTYDNIPQDQDWALEMYRGSQKMQGSDHEEWQDGESGWAAYELSEDLSDNPLAGPYTVKLLIGDKVVQKASFEVAVQPITQISFPAFGPITFAHDVNDESAAIDPTSSFEPGTSQVYAVFPFVNMSADTGFKREWLLNGEVTAEKEMAWDDTSEGVTYANLHADGGLDPGNYTLNLYIDGQLARSAKFEVQAPEATPEPTGAPDVPSTPDELIDGTLLPAWQMLENFPDTNVKWLADYILEQHIKIGIDPDYNGLMSFSYVCTVDPPRRAGDVGEIKVSNQFFNEASWVELAGALVHETTHAIQRVEGQPCGCTIAKEYEAYSVQGGFWVKAGRGDLVTAYVGDDIFDPAGNFDKNKFWDAVKAIYSNCPDY